MIAPVESVAIIPAAGASRRMGRPKLLLPWGGSTVIENVLATWRAGGVDRTVVVLRPGNAELEKLCRAAGAETVVPPAPPADMKASLAIGLSYAAGQFSLADNWYWLTAPADIPTLSPEVIGQLLREHSAHPDAALVPIHAGRRGHPVLLPGKARSELASLGPREGLKDLLLRIPVREVDGGPAALGKDLDTPADYRRLRP